MVTKLTDIYSFTQKWLGKFRNPDTKASELEDIQFGTDCSSLGFEMDCGQAFVSMYGKAWDDNENLKQIIDDVTDINLLGSAIYSKWRYFNHWAMNESIADEENRAWFITALERLSNLCEEDTSITHRQLKKIRLVSNNISYGPMPEPDREVEQHLTITNKGRIFFSSYLYGEGFGKFKKDKSASFKIEPEVAQKLLDTIGEFFHHLYKPGFVTDVGSWKLELTDEDGKSSNYMGSLYAEVLYYGKDLSDLIRETLGMPELILFDNQFKLDCVKKVTLDYHRITKSSPSTRNQTEKNELTLQEYRERLIVDGPSHEIQIIQDFGSGKRAHYIYELGENIQDVLDEFDADDLLLTDKDLNTPSDHLNQTREYTLAIDYNYAPSQTIKGSFDKDSLPYDFKEFAKAVSELLKQFQKADILNPEIYTKRKRRKDEFILCSVQFGHQPKNYYYLSDDDSILPGDYVVVPAGLENKEVEVQVKKVEYITKENAPMPIEIIKHILYKSDDADSIH